MLNAQGIWACFLFEIKKLLHSSRFYATLFFVCFVIWDHIAPISTWIASIDSEISVWVYPFISSSVFLQMVIIGGIIFLFSDSPFFSETQPLLIVRIGRIQWYIAQLLYIYFAALIYLIIVAAISTILFFPNITTEFQWGKIIMALSSGEADIENVMSFSSYITRQLTPIKATCLSLTLSWMAAVSIAEIQFFFNLNERKQTGSVVAGLLVLQDLFSLMILSESSEKYSIVTLTRLSVLLRNETMFGIDAVIYSLVALFVLIQVFAVLCLMRIRDTEIYLTTHAA